MLLVAILFGTIVAFCAIVLAIIIETNLYAYFHSGRHGFPRSRRGRHAR